MRKQLKDICRGFTKNIALKDLGQHEGQFPIYGASGYIKDVDFYCCDTPYIGIVKDGSGVGRVDVYPGYSSLLGTMQYVVPNDNVDLHYLKYALTAMNLGSLYKGAAIPHIYFKEYGKFFVDLPDLKTQKHISALLGTIQKAIDLKRKQLETLDELVKSKFQEMFGDVDANDKGFETILGKDAFVFSSGKVLPSEKRKEEGIPVYGGNGISWYTDEALIDYSTIIIGRVGAYCGNVKMVNTPVWITDNAIFIKSFKKQVFNIQFLCQLMENASFYKYADVVAQPKITQKPLENYKYIVPSIALQEEFAVYVNSVEKVRIIVTDELSDLEELMDSKMDEYFG